MALGSAHALLSSCGGAAIAFVGMQLTAELLACAGALLPLQLQEARVRMSIHNNILASLSARDHRHPMTTVAMTRLGGP